MKLIDVGDGRGGHGKDFPMVSRPLGLLSQLCARAWSVSNISTIATTIFLDEENVREYTHVAMSAATVDDAFGFVSPPEFEYCKSTTSVQLQ